MRRTITVAFATLLVVGSLAGCATPPPKRTGSAGTVTETVTNPNPPGGQFNPSPPAAPGPPGTVTVPSGPVVTDPRAATSGAAVGGAAGAGAGALIDKNNRWRGALIGGAVGALLGGTVNEIRSRATREAVAGNRPAAYETEDGWQRVETYPQSTASPRGCRQVRELVYHDGQLVQDTLREVCP
jgi:hypothetical protein